MFFLYYFSFSLLWLGYYIFMVPIFGYSGFEWHPNQLKIIEAVLALAFVLIFMPTKFSKPSDILLHIQLLLPIMGMLVLYGASDKPRLYTYMVISAFLFMVFIVKYVKLKPFKLIKLSLSSTQKVLFVSACLAILYIISFGGLKFINFDLQSVYKYRTDSAENLPGIYGYISPMISKVVLPFSLLLAFINKDRMLALASIAASVLMFALTSHKGPLFYPFFTLIIYFVASRKKPIIVLLISYSLVVVLSLLYFLYDNESIMLGSLFLRRVYFVPAHLNYLYYDFFSSNAFVFWAESKLTFGVVDYKYLLDVPHLIGFEYYSDQTAGANTGWIGSGYMQLGFAGMIIYTFIIGVLLGFLNVFSKVIDKRVIVAIMVVPMLPVMMSSDLPTAFLSHGVILSLLILSSFVYRNRKSNML